MRKNKGNHEGKYLGDVLDNAWGIYQTAKGYRVSAVGAVNGKANYSFVLTKVGRIDTHTNIDATKLKEERIELYEAVERFFSSADNASLLAVDDDKFGDIAMSQGKQLTPMQQWHRALLQMRMHELEHTAKPPTPGTTYSTWDAGIRMSYSGIFKFKIDDETYEQAARYITNHAPELELQTLLMVLRDYYGGKYRPKPCSTLDVQFDLIAGDANETRVQDLL